MIYDITKPTPPEMPTLDKGLETQKLLLSRTSKDMFQPEHPMLYAPLGAKISGSKFLTLSEIAAKIVAFGNLKKSPEPRRLGAVMTKLGYKKERKGHDCRRGYWVREHLQTEIEQMHGVDIF